MRQQMPEVDLAKLFLEMTKEEYHITKRLVATRGKNKGLLRASKPPVDNDLDPESGKAAYVWRMVAFMASPMPAHRCMPVCAEFDLPGKFSERKELVKELDALVNKIAATLPVSAGALSWARGFGIIK